MQPLGPRVSSFATTVVYLDTDNRVHCNQPIQYPTENNVVGVAVGNGFIFFLHIDGRVTDEDDNVLVNNVLLLTPGWAFCLVLTDTGEIFKLTMNGGSNKCKLPAGIGKVKSMAAAIDWIAIDDAGRAFIGNRQIPGSEYVKASLDDRKAALLSTNGNIFVYDIDTFTLIAMRLPTDLIALSVEISDGSVYSLLDDGSVFSHGSYSCPMIIKPAFERIRELSTGTQLHLLLEDGTLCTIATSDDCANASDSDDY